MTPRPELKEALSTLREHLDIDCMEADGRGRYVLEFDAVGEINDAIDEIEKLLGLDVAEVRGR